MTKMCLKIFVSQFYREFKSKVCLLFQPTGAMVCLIFYYFCSETWFAILFTVITEVCQPQVKSTLIAVFLFLMNNVGGNLPVVVTSGMVASAGIEKSVLNLFALWRNMTLRHSSFFVGEQGISSFF